MPLNLLQHKSWNPYSSAAVARVKGDEQAVSAAERAHKELLDAHEARSTAARLRGLPEPASPPSLNDFVEERLDQLRRERRVNRPVDNDKEPSRGELSLKRTGGNAHANHTTEKDGRLTVRDNEATDVPLTDERGHIQLFAPKEPQAHRPNDKSKDHPSHRGPDSRHHSARDGADSDKTPWYAEKVSFDRNRTSEVGEMSHDVTPNHDARRAQRNQTRLHNADPLTAMLSAQSSLRSAKNERRRLLTEREEDVKMLRHSKPRRHRDEHRVRKERKRSHRSDSHRQHGSHHRSRARSDAGSDDEHGEDRQRRL